MDADGALTFAPAQSTMAASIFANAQSLRFGAKSEDLTGRPGTGSVQLSVTLQRWQEEDEWWDPLGVAGVRVHAPEEITFGDVTFEGLAVEPDDIQQWHAAQAGDRIVFQTGEEDTDIIFATINLV